MPKQSGSRKGARFRFCADIQKQSPHLTSPMEWGKDAILPPLRGGTKGGSSAMWCRVCGTPPSNFPHKVGEGLESPPVSGTTVSLLCERSHKRDGSQTGTLLPTSGGLPAALYRGGQSPPQAVRETHHLRRLSNCSTYIKTVVPFTGGRKGVFSEAHCRVPLPKKEPSKLGATETREGFRRTLPCAATKKRAQQAGRHRDA
jgi:hypothetical protein